MKAIPVKPMRRIDWANYLDTEDQARIKKNPCYRISGRLDAVVDRKGKVALILHQDGEYQTDTILSKRAMAKLAYVLLNGRKAQE
ncbi:MAG: hypothetical protein HY549_01560, partial [Elusimicrobia bacterium]|nr:hypothetical protein [Elusimicrobiota bacterium]